MTYSVVSVPAMFQDFTGATTPDQELSVNEETQALTITGASSGFTGSMTEASTGLLGSIAWGRVFTNAMAGASSGFIGSTTLGGVFTNAMTGASSGFTGSTTLGGVFTSAMTLTQAFSERPSDIRYPAELQVSTFAPSSGFTGTTGLARKLFETATRPPRPGVILEFSSGAYVFAALQSFYLSANKPRDRQIAERIISIHRAVLEEDGHILPASLAQFTRFFLEHSELALPKITLTPDGTLRARWISGPENFVAIEFTGQPLAKLVAEVPRQGGLTAPHFASEPLDSIIPIARAIGASFAQ